MVREIFPKQQLDFDEWFEWDVSRDRSIEFGALKKKMLRNPCGFIEESFMDQFSMRSLSIAVAIQIEIR